MQIEIVFFPLFLISMSFISFSCFTELARTSCTILNSSGKSRRLCLLPDLREKAFSLSPFSMMFAESVHRFFFFFLNSHTCGIWKLPGRELNPSCSCDLLIHGGSQVLNPHLHSDQSHSSQILNPLCHSHNSLDVLYHVEEVLFYFYFSEFLP